MVNNIPHAIEMLKIADMYELGHEGFSQRKQRLQAELEEAISDIMDKIEKAANNGKGFMYYDMSLIRHEILQEVIDEFLKHGYIVSERQSYYSYVFDWCNAKG